MSAVKNHEAACPIQCAIEIPNNVWLLKFCNSINLQKLLVNTPFFLHLVINLG